MPTIEISKIVVANRHRKDMGDINSLANSIREVGLLHPIVLNSSNVLIAGERRLEAVKQLGWTGIEATIAENFNDAQRALLAERDENVERESFTASEAVALGKKLEALERPKAAERMRSSTKNDEKTGRFTGSDKLSEPDKGQVREKVGAAVGMSGAQYGRAKTAVERGIPELVEALDRRELPMYLAAEIAMHEPEKQKALLEDHKAGRKLAKEIKQQPKTDIVPKTRTTPGRKAPEAIRGAIGTLVGLASGLDSFTVKDAAPSPAEAEQWEKDLAVVVSVINRFRRELKEYARV